MRLEGRVGAGEAHGAQVQERRQHGGIGADGGEARGVRGEGRGGGVLGRGRRGQRGDQAALAASITDQIIDEFCLVGPPSRCRERLEAFRAAGVDFAALLIDPVEPGEDYRGALERTLKALAPHS